MSVVRAALRQGNPYPEPRTYDRLLRTWTFAGRRGRIVGGIALMIVAFLLSSLVLMPLLVFGVWVQTRIGHTAFGPAFSAAASGSSVTPASMVWLNLSIASGVLIAVVLERYLHRLHPAWLLSVLPGVRWRFLGACTAAAVVAIAASLAVAQLWPSTAEFSSSVVSMTRSSAVLAVVLLLTTPLQAIGEEFVFRGYLMQAFGSLLSGWAAVLITSVLFALAHGVQDGPLFIDRLAFGVMASYLVLRTGGLEAGIAMHVLNNLTAFGFALAYGQMGQVLTSTSAPWQQLFVTATQDGLYVVAVVLVARRMGLRRTTPEPDGPISVASA